MTATLLVGDVHERQTQLEDHSFDLIITSPPFYNLRSYLPDDHPDKAKEIGSERTPADWLDTMLALTAEWRRLLAPHGSIAVEIGDCYAGSGGAGGDYDDNGLRAGQPKFRADWSRSGVLEQSLIGIPHAYALSLTLGRNIYRNPAPPSPAGQWMVRNYKAWFRTNPPVGALGKKERPATSYITVATLARDRWFDLDAVRTTNPRIDEPGLTGSKNKDTGIRGVTDAPQNAGGAPPLDWWHQTDAVIDRELQTVGLDETCMECSHRRYHHEGTGKCCAYVTDKDPDVLELCWCPQFRSSKWNPIDAVIDRELQTRVSQPGPTPRNGDPKAQAGRHSGMLPSAGSGSSSSALANRTYHTADSAVRGHHIRKALEKAGILPPHPDALDISPKGYSGAHYAVWPPELVRQLVDEMCPRRVCVTCGEPSRRITQTDPEYQKQRDAYAARRAETHNGSNRSNPLRARGGNSSKGLYEPGHITANLTTVGWSDCGHGTWRPGNILDPFVGSGTTLAVASGMGRDSVGIDLDPRSADLCSERVGMLLEVVEGRPDVSDTTGATT